MQFDGIPCIGMGEITYSFINVKAENRVNEEAARLKAVFCTSSRVKLMKICDHELLAVRQKQLLQMGGSGVKALILGEKYNGNMKCKCLIVIDLSRLYKLMSRIEGGLQPIAAIFQEYISLQGKDIYNRMLENLKEISEYTKFVKLLLDSYVIDLMELHKKMDLLVTRAFQNSLVFQRALAQGFKTFVDCYFKTSTGIEVKTPQLFAYYCDELLRKKEDALDVRK